MIDERYYTGTVGLSYIIEPEIAFVTILTVSRNGAIYKKVGSSPTGREFVYTSTGRIDFGTAIEEVTITTPAGEYTQPEKVYVKFKV
jgi:hypothetical protein